MIILATILFFAVLAWDLITDYRKWLDQRSVKHTKEAWIRAGLLLPSMLLFTIAHPGSFVWSGICAALMGFFTYWFLFDGIYNKLRGFGWWFTGSEDPDDSYLDKFALAIGLFWHQVFKISGMTIFLTIYFLTYFKK